MTQLTPLSLDATVSAPPHRKLRVAVLMGGTSSERAVSLSTGKQIVSALDPTKYEVAAIDTKDVLTLSAQQGKIEDERPENKKIGDGKQETGENAPNAEHPTPNTVSSKPDIVFIALHGKGGEDGTVQGMLELLGLPYTGSGVLASALAMDKGRTKKLFRSENIPVIDDVQVTRQQMRDGADLIDTVQIHLGGVPVFVKPNAEGSTVGGSLVTQIEELIPAVETALKYDSVVIVEKYVRGVEITVGVLGNTSGNLDVLPVVEIVPKSGFYDYESKYGHGGSEHIIPARLPDTMLCYAQDIARQCHTLLGCRGMSRSDMIVAGNDLYVLEVNTIPGMTPTSLLPQAAETVGISFPILLDRIIASALEPK